MRVEGFTPGGKDRRRFEAALTPPYDLLWKVGVDTGLRIGDLLRLRVCELIGMADGLYVIETKTNKTRKVKLTAATVKHAMALLAARSALSFVWESPRIPGQSIHRTTAYRAFRAARELSGAKTKVGTHTARKTFAQNLYKKSDIETVQEVLRHRFPSTTLFYVVNPRTRRRPAGG